MLPPAKRNDPTATEFGYAWPPSQAVTNANLLIVETARKRKPSREAVFRQAQEEAALRIAQEVKFKKMEAARLREQRKKEKQEAALLSKKEQHADRQQKGKEKGKGKGKGKAKAKDVQGGAGRRAAWGDEVGAGMHQANPREGNKKKQQAQTKSPSREHKDGNGREAALPLHPHAIGGDSGGSVGAAAAAWNAFAAASPKKRQKGTATTPSAARKKTPSTGRVRITSDGGMLPFLVGTQISVRWDADMHWYAGVIVSWDEESLMHEVQYHDDGNFEWLNLGTNDYVRVRP